MRLARPGELVGLNADQEKRGRGVLALEHVENLRCPLGIGAIVEGERDFVGAVAVTCHAVRFGQRLEILVGNQFRVRRRSSGRECHESGDLQCEGFRPGPPCPHPGREARRAVCRRRRGRRERPTRAIASDPRRPAATERKSGCPASARRACGSAPSPHRETRRRGAGCAHPDN